MLKETPDGIVLEVFLQPNASKNEVVGEFNGRLKIKVQSPPVEGAANAALVEFVKSQLGIRKNQIELIRGEKSRKKDLLLKEVSMEVVRNILFKSSL